MRSFASKVQLIRHLQNKHIDLSIKKEELSIEQLLQQQNIRKQTQQLNRGSHSVRRRKGLPITVRTSRVRKTGNVYKLNSTI